MKMMEAHGVHKMSLVGISYGGFVGYRVAAHFPEVVEKIVLCCAGVCLEEVDMENGLFRVSNLDEASSILLPQTPDKLRELMKLSFVRPARGVPTWFLQDFIQVINAFDLLFFLLGCHILDVCFVFNGKYMMNN